MNGRRVAIRAPIPMPTVTAVTATSTATVRRDGGTTTDRTRARAAGSVAPTIVYRNAGITSRANRRSVAGSARSCVKNTKNVIPRSTAARIRSTTAAGVPT